MNLTPIFLSFLFLIVIMVLVLRGFVFKVRWHLSEMMLVMIFCSIPIGLIFKANEKHIKNFGDVVALSPFAFLSVAPILMGSWWGLRTADRVKESSLGKRLFLIAAGTALVIGAFTAVPAVFSTIGLILKPSPEALSECIPVWALSSLLIPSVLIERHYRKRRAMEFAAARQQRLEKARTAKTSTKNNSAESGSTDN